MLSYSLCCFKLPNAFLEKMGQMRTGLFSWSSTPFTTFDASYKCSVLFATCCEEKVELLKESHNETKVPKKWFEKSLATVLCWGRAVPILLTLPSCFFSTWTVSFWEKGPALFWVANPLLELPVTIACTFSAFRPGKSIGQGLNPWLAEVSCCYSTQQHWRSRLNRGEGPRDEDGNSPSSLLLTWLSIT